MPDSWLAGENIEVEVQQLDDFAEHIRAELEHNFEPSLKNGILNMLTIESTFGAGGLGEAKFFGERHDQSRAAVASLLNEAGQGLLTLATAAKAIAFEYRNGDAFAAATQEDVYAKFEGTSLETQSEGQPAGESEPEQGIPLEAQDPSKYFTGENAAEGTTTNTGAGGGLYDQTTYGSGPGAYTVKADDQQMNNECLDIPTNTATH